MSRVGYFLIVGLLIGQTCFSQLSRSDLYTDFVLYAQRVSMEKDLRERVTGKAFTMPLDSNTEYKYELACEAVSQFQFTGPAVEGGMEKLFAGYDSLPVETREAFLAAVYAVYPRRYTTAIRSVLDKEEHPRLFAICGAYLFRDEPTIANGNSIKIRMVEKFPGYDSVSVLQELEKYISRYSLWVRGKTPDIVRLFEYRRAAGGKTIYSFQRWDRDYPGLAIVQDAGGHFVKNEAGRLAVFEQLARSGSDLPYFIRNGSTPQGIYSIQGLGVSHNHFIGPTPNIQMIMPFEKAWADYFHWEDDSMSAEGAGGRSVSVGADRAGGSGGESGLGVSDAEGSFGRTGAPGRMNAYGAVDSLQSYRGLLPPSWRQYEPMMEAWNAGRVGRTEIIAHGSTLDPAYFREKAFYPLTPTEGCLCAKELWNPTTGHSLVSEQLDLVNAYGNGMAKSGKEGKGSKDYLIVINVDDQRKAVSREEVEAWVKRYEQGR